MIVMTATIYQCLLCAKCFRSIISKSHRNPNLQMRKPRLGGLSNLPKVTVYVNWQSWDSYLVVWFLTPILSLKRL